MQLDVLASSLLAVLNNQMARAHKIFSHLHYKQARLLPHSGPQQSFSCTAFCGALY